MKTGFLIGSALLTLFAVAPCALASPVSISFHGANSDGYAQLEIMPSPAAGQANGDPANAMLITDANGTFSDSTLGISNASITGVVDRNFAPEPAHEDLLKSYSAHLYDPTDPTAGAFSYDNLFYADGSPVVCPPNLPWVQGYPYSGGFLDVFGALFTLDNGKLLALWSNGVTPAGLSYGFNVIDPQSDGSYTRLTPESVTVAASVPEPGPAWLLLAGIVGLLIWRRQSTLRSQNKTT